MSEENSEPSVSGQDRRGIDARFSTLEASVKQIQQTLQVIAQQQLAPRSPSTGLQAGLGMATIVSTAVPSVQTGSAVHAPPFVSTEAVGGGALPNANLTMPLHAYISYFIFHILNIFIQGTNSIRILFYNLALLKLKYLINYLQIN